MPYGSIMIIIAVAVFFSGLSLPWRKKEILRPLLGNNAFLVFTTALLLNRELTFTSRPGMMQELEGDHSGIREWNGDRGRTTAITGRALS